MSQKFDRAQSSERLLTPQETATFLRVSVSWLAKARMTGGGPPFRRVGRLIRYDRTELERWLKGNGHHSTSEYVTRLPDTLDADGVDDDVE